MDFYGDACLRDPVSAYHQMLELGPVVWMPQLGMHAICGFSELTAALRDHRVFQSGKGVSVDEETNKFLIGSTLNSDPPDHDKTRAITFAPLTPKALQHVRDRVEAEAEFIAEKLTTQQEFDAAAELAPYLPLTIVRDLVGLGEGGSDHMLGWGAATFELMGDPKERRPDAQQQLGKLREFLNDPDMLQGLSPDGWANRATQCGIAEGMDPARAITLMRDYIAPSLDTTISVIGYAIMLFAKHPEQWDKLRADRSLIKNAIEGIVRLNTPIKSFSRHVSEDIQIGDVGLKVGSRVMVVYGAANRDAVRFDDPDAFDIERNTRGHLGFGHGVHACLGMHLARLEITSLFNALADRVSRFDLTGPVVPSINSTIHSLAQVPVRASA